MKKLKPDTFLNLLLNPRISVLFGIGFLVISIIFFVMSIGASGIASDLSSGGYSDQIEICKQLYPDTNSTTQNSVEYFQKRQCIDQVNNYKSAFYQNWASILIAISGIAVGIGGILIAIPKAPTKKPQPIKKKTKKYLTKGIIKG